MARSSWLIRQNGPDLRRDYDLPNFLSISQRGRLVRMDLIYEGITTDYLPFVLGTFHIVRMDLIYEGITTQTAAAFTAVGLQASEWTWFTKGLRHNVKLCCIVIILSRSEWTWFTKGLRLADGSLAMPHDNKVRMDLIYEGITTPLTSSGSLNICSQNGPDLRRDYDVLGYSRLLPGTLVRMDLIYEGITTSFGFRFFKTSQASEWTWFTKGLRHLLRAVCVIGGPYVRMDLIYEGITTEPSGSSTKFHFPSEWTWFTKGLRL